jgi:hypothetical protein
MRGCSLPVGTTRRARRLRTDVSALKPRHYRSLVVRYDLVIVSERSADPIRTRSSGARHAVEPTIRQLAARRVVHPPDHRWRQHDQTQRWSADGSRNVSKCGGVLSPGLDRRHTPVSVETRARNWLAGSRNLERPCGPRGLALPPVCACNEATRPNVGSVSTVSSAVSWKPSTALAVCSVPVERAPMEHDDTGGGEDAEARHQV